MVFGVFISLKIFILEYSWFTVLCLFQVSKRVIQLYMVLAFWNNHMMETVSLSHSWGLAVSLSHVWVPQTQLIQALSLPHGTPSSQVRAWGMVSGARPVGSQFQLCHALGELPEDAPSFLRTFSDGSGLGQSFLLIQAEESFAFGECCVKGENIKQMKRELVGKGREALWDWWKKDPLHQQHYSWFWGHATKAGLSWTM